MSRVSGAQRAGLVRTERSGARSAAVAGFANQARSDGRNVRSAAVSRCFDELGFFRGTA
ncbi:MAG TPA: hypothetical protein VNC13_09825 [Propionibacteriaceae bacterium]|nr:hypothetical protein [Propionibacteriaceae bacterium]